MKILVTDGNTRPALAITRALGREGHEVIVGAEKHPSLASSSRFCSSRLTYSDPREKPLGFDAEILAFIKRAKPDVVLPVTEITTLLIMENYDHLKQYCSIPFPKFEYIDRAANKLEVMQLAERLEIPIPKTVYLNDPDDLESKISSCAAIGYPIVIKPARSRVRIENGWQSGGVRYAYDGADLRTYLNSEKSILQYPLLLQERIYGDAVGVFLCFNKGETVAAFCHRRLREKPPSGGVSVLRESIPLRPELRDYSEKLLRALNWRGVAMIEFKQDNRTGEFNLMEINGRFWGSLQLAIDAGVNFPSMLVSIASGQHNEPVNDYAVGVKTRWFWGDVDALLARLLKSDKKLQLPPAHPTRMRTIFDFFHFWGRDLFYEVEDFSDAGPWLFETRNWFSGGKA
jgi:predicted ATP-grasp superfamily ATP-dependent carboligase